MSDRNQWLIDLYNDPEIWATELDCLPVMISYPYRQLKSFAEEGQVYGIMLQCKDLFESLMKVPVLMALMTIDADPDHFEKQSYHDIVNKLLASTMSMGSWDELAMHIVKHGSELHVHEVLVSILRKTRRLYANPLNGESVNIVNWRNNTIGHGALRFEDDPSYQQEVKALLEMLKEYFDGNKRYSITGLYEKVFLVMDGEKLTGNADLFWKTENELKLIVDGKEIRCVNYIFARELKGFLFETYFSRRQVLKYTSYTDGKSETAKNAYFAGLYERFVAQGNRNFEINSDFISRENEMILEYLNMAMDYVKPQRLIQRLEETLEEMGRGIISIFMERGTGKSAFANQMSGLYHSTSLIPGSFSRCVHVQNISMRGISDFVNSVNFGFRHSFNPANDLYGSTDVLPSLKLDSETPKADMADFLNYYHERYRQEFTILVIDGIDEISADTEKILDFVPSAKQLEEGVFVILLSRFKDEKTIRGHNRKYIETAETISDQCIEVRRKEEFNTDVLNEYIDHQVKEGLISKDSDRDALLNKADYRFLYLKAYFAIRHDVLFDNTDETHFIAGYMNHLLSFYGPVHADQLKEFAVSAALCPGLTIRKYCDLISCSAFTCELAGLINGLLPLMSVYRIDDEEVIQYADEAYAEFVLREYGGIAHETVRKINQLFVSLKETVMERNDSLANILRHEFTPAETQTLIFIGESVYNIYRLSAEYKDHELFCEFTEIFALVWMLQWSAEGLQGYGPWLSRELTECLAKGLLHCAKYEKTELSANWLHTVSAEACRDVLNFQKLLIKTSVSENGHLIALGKCLKTSAKPTDDLSDWFWLFETMLSEDICELLVSNEERMAQFLDFVRENSLPIVDEKLRSAFSEYSLPKHIKEKLESLSLALSLPHELRTIHDNERENILKCLKRMEEKGYQLDWDIFNEADRLILRRINEDDLNEVIYQTLSTQSIEILNDSQSALDHDPAKAKTISSMLQYVHDCAVFGTQVSEKTKAFNLALYERILVEDTRGTLPQFVQSVKASDEAFLEMLASISDQDSIFDYSSSLSRIAQKYAGLGNSYFVSLAANLKIISMIIFDGETEQRNSIFEELIIQDDTPAYIASFYRDEQNDMLQQLMKQDDRPIFCTPNTLVLLNTYRKEGKTDQLKQLCLLIDSSVPEIIDRYLYMPKFRTEAEMMVFRYCKYRERNVTDDSFDQYVSSLIENHTDAIKDFRNNISRNSDFHQLLLHIEIILEYYWLNKEWKAGIEKCRQLHEILDVNSTDDLHPALIKSINMHVDLIDTVKNLLSYISGVPYEETESSAEFRHLGFGMLSRFINRGIIIQAQSFAGGRMPVAADYMSEEKPKLQLHVRL